MNNSKAHRVLNEMDPMFTHAANVASHSTSSTPHPCAERCQYAQDIGMPEHRCANGCMYERHGQVPQPNRQEWDEWKPARDVS